jgi:protein involved in polysaccharide export with SLBB domain
VAVALLCLDCASSARANRLPDWRQDVLNITVFGESELSGKYTVEQDGTFTFPLVGRVKAGGTTLREFEQVLKKQLTDGILKNPQVRLRSRPTAASGIW